MNLALFDLDNTLLAGDSDFEWAQYLISRGVLDREVYEARNQDFYEQYKAGTLDIHEFLDFQLKPLSRHPRRELDAWHADFMARHILPMVTEQGRELVRRHQAEGALTAIVTATNSFVTAPIARAFGIEHLIATEPERANGEFTGRVSGTPSFREGKIARVEAWLAGLGHGWQSFGRSWFYSDSLNDLPLLGKVTDPVAVDPDPTLERHARERGWPIITLR
ncbi:MAG: HAD-IB family hydrolase [Burkholderiales bacterium]|jgi:HAD superfamily hydrolase (TIGR01490 family)|nr:HAD family hydrolase [Zoogloeaceae bacterium]MBP9653766.1 HAD family hydrolase [Rhodocyclaceae bacterium]MCZ2173472.1 HAD-IB family hydrolase [Burkholderiales bacterium]HNQ57238.1 HAD family hydrolase [Candidatus Desulfobacillus denitrificans]MBV6409958.1 putative phosphatase [Rhodocyclaceae bacterium]